MRVPLHTPRQAGFYVLIIEMARSGNGWFSANGTAALGVLEADIHPDHEAWFGQADVSRWHRSENLRLFVGDFPASRFDLWKAAFQIVRDNPILGGGPDNFRLLYGRRLYASRSDPEIRANNLYLELLAGSGLLGLAAFLGMLAVVRWKWIAPAAAVGIFLLHGFVDDFLMTTPVYCAFWILLGLTHRRLEPSDLKV
jgi:hypothetical protein